MSSLIRSLLILFLLAVCIVLVAVHGFIRALVIGMVLVVVTTVPKTRAWRIGERWLVRLTGSRRRAALAATLMVIVPLAAVNIYSFFH